MGHDGAVRVPQVDPGRIPTRGPESDVPENLGFVPRRRVRWLRPSVLARTAQLAVVSSLFGRYADRRELQAIEPAEVVDLADRDELWIDYTADTGDGFDAATTVASVLAREHLDLGGTRTSAGSLLVWGGDQVYPAAAPDAYRDRFVGPWRSMLPWTPNPRLAVAVPGNHDWYDGLVSFTRLLCQGRWIGGWKTVQSRSYFALRLPGGWWLWGIDIQLEDDIDEPQLDYFRARSAEVAEGEAIILCSAKPSWTAAGPDAPEAYQTLEFFERTVIGDRARLRVSLTGDSHHYARYEGPEGQQKITAGGGGAFLAGTHHLPDELRLPPKESRDPGRGPEIPYHLRATYPTPAESRAMRGGVFRETFRNGRFWLVPAVLYGLLALAGAHTPDSPGAAGWLIALGAAMVLALAALTQVHSPQRWLLGSGHAAAHLGVACVAAWVASIVAGSIVTGSVTPGDGSVAGPLAEAVLSATALGVGGLAGALLGPVLFAGYLFLADRVGPRGVNSSELFAVLAREDHKSFVRLHIDREGTLTVYPVAVPRAARWHFAGPGRVATQRWFEPDAEPEARLIEPPIRIPRRGALPERT